MHETMVRDTSPNQEQNRYLGRTQLLTGTLFLALAETVGLGTAPVVADAALAVSGLVFILDGARRQFLD